MTSREITSQGSGRPDLADRRWRGLSSRLSTILSDPRALIANLRLNASMGRSDRKHLFIVGLSRSGTSLLATRVASSPEVATVNGETFFFQKRDFSRVDVSGVDIPQYRQHFLTAKSRVDLFNVMADYALSQKPSSRYFLEKSPDHVFMLHDLMVAYPSARFVFCIRDPRDAYVSWQKHPQLADVTAEAFARYWNRCHEVFRGIKDERLTSVRYEDLCLEPDATLHRVASHFGLADLIDTAEKTEEGSDWRYLKMGGHARITDAINPATLGVWQKALDPEAANIIDAACEQGMRIWGYT